MTSIPHPDYPLPSISLLYIYVSRINCRTASAVCPSLFTVPPGGGQGSPSSLIIHPPGVLSRFGRNESSRSFVRDLPHLFGPLKGLQSGPCFSFAACLTNCVCSLTKKQGRKNLAKNGAQKGVVQASSWLGCSLNAFW
ncbi:hypothetical protein CDAR_496301 [Caerostris darwini]|uniref:Uncharacterized protein n=1 Tax=Caerostris darwini TaxID=1538125 RepID=A0AAV4MVJ0_9ARAC|nr:hypothetical protein CDAR_496301 [Caerostris darwini]